MIERALQGRALGWAPRLARQALAWPSREKRQAWSARFAAAGPGALSLLAGMVAWEVIGRTWAIPFLPPFSKVVAASVRMTLNGQITADLWESLGSLALGYGLAAILGVSVGLAMGRYRKVEYALDPILTGMLASPKLLFVPVLYALFGVSRGAQVAVIFLSALFIIVINTMSAVRTVDLAAVEMARVFGASRRQLFWKVLLPGSLPLTMAGLRLGMGRAVKGMITGEMFITLFGLGALLRKYGSRFDAASVFAVLLVVVAVALICTHAVHLVEQRVTRWAGPTD
jgi:NitT/TauT family transport system permease protein